MVLILPHLVWDLYCHVLLLEVTSIRKVELSVIFQLSYHVLLFFYCLSAWTHFLSFATAAASTTLLYGNSCAATFFGSSCCSFAELNYMQTSLLSSTHLFSPLFYFLLSPLLFGSSSCSYSDLNNVQTSILSSLTSLLLSSIFFSLLSYLTVAAAPLLI